MENTPFINMLIKKYPKLDINNLLEIFDRQHQVIRQSELSTALKSDLNKHLLVSILDEYNFTQKTKKINKL